MEIGELIRAYLKRRETTQRWLSNMMNIDEKTLSGKLNRNSISADELLQIGKLLDIDLNKLKKGEILMLKYFSPAWIVFHDKDEELSNKIGEKIYSDGENGYSELYRVVGDDEFIYKAENERAISDYLGIDISKYSGGIEKYLEGCDGGEHIKIGFMEIGLSDCMQKLMDNIDSYERQIYEADNPTDEIYNILKSFLPLLIDEGLSDMNKDIDDLKSKIKDGTFEW